jgi:hypothetical protein
MLGAETRTMWKHRAIAGLMAGLLLGVTPALAFEEEPVPPPAGSDTGEAKAAPIPPAMQLGTANAPADPKAERKGGLNVFGYNVFPKLNFGLDVLYGQEQQKLDLQQGPTTLEENGDVSVLGKVKRRF